MLIGLQWWIAAPQTWWHSRGETIQNAFYNILRVAFAFVHLLFKCFNVYSSDSKHLLTTFPLKLFLFLIDRKFLWRKMNSKTTNSHLFTIQKYPKKIKMNRMKYFVFIRPEQAVRWEHHPCLLSISIFPKTAFKHWKYVWYKIQWVWSNTTESDLFSQILLFQNFDIRKHSLYCFK